jgi:hypothetical protein
MFFLIVLGAMLGAAAVILFQQWRGGVFTVDRISLPPPSLVRPHGVSRHIRMGMLRVDDHAPTRA